MADDGILTLPIRAPRAPRPEDVVDGRPVIMLRSFSKTFGLAGLRLGFAIADPEVARLLDIVQEPFNVNRIALAAGRAAISHPEFLPARRAEVAEAREALAAAARARAGLLEACPRRRTSCSSSSGSTTGPMCAALLRHGLLIRGGHEFGLPGLARVTIAPGT